MIFVPSSFIRLSEPISRGTVTGQRNSRTRSRVSCPTSRTSEHSRAGARGCDVRMFGCLPLEGPHREGGLFAELRKYVPLRRTTLTQQLFGPRPKFRRPYSSGIANSARHRRSPKGRARRTISHFDRLSSIETKIAPRSTRIAAGRLLQQAWSPPE
jgi:hypothetical protein